VAVSDASWSKLPAQARDAERFLSKHKREIARLSRFPVSLVRAAGKLGSALELSIYPPRSRR